MRFCGCGAEASVGDLCVRCSNEATGHRTVRYTGKRIFRNQPCPCGSGRKFKNCHRADTLVTEQVELKPRPIPTLEEARIQVTRSS